MSVWGEYARLCDVFGWGVGEEWEGHQFLGQSKRAHLAWNSSLPLAPLGSLSNLEFDNILACSVICYLPSLPWWFHNILLQCQ